MKTIPISVYLRPSPEFHMLFCMLCKSGMSFRIGGVPKVIALANITKPNEVLGENVKALQFPIKYKCDRTFENGEKCPALYLVQGFVED